MNKYYFKYLHLSLCHSVTLSLDHYSKIKNADPFRKTLPRQRREYSTFPVLDLQPFYVGDQQSWENKYIIAKAIFLSNYRAATAYLPYGLTCRPKPFLDKKKCRNHCRSAVC